jgi:hypothetical protein
MYRHFYIQIAPLFICSLSRLDRGNVMRAPLLFLGMLSLVAAAGCAAKVGSAAIHEDFVPNAKTAIAIAEVVARAQFGERQLAQIVPFEAVLDTTIWRVTSKIGLGEDAAGKGGFRGVTMNIRRDTGEIVFYGYYPFD